MGEVQDRLKEIRKRAENALVGSNSDEEKEKTNSSVKQKTSRVQNKSRNLN